ncbi:MAG: hypothetical protein HOH04_05220, partial [Rhodospirillaceae bacterium]|nr:hypothetical protein [Rhodospirillaceae bacterium]
MKKSFLRSAVDSVSKLLSVEQEEDAPAPEKPRAKPSSRQSQPLETPKEKAAEGPKALDMQGLERNVQRLVKQRGEAMIGRVRVLRFDELAESVPLKHVKEFLKAVDSIVRRHLSAQDNLRMVEGGACLIVFGSRDTEQADATCAAVCSDIEKLVAARPELSGKVQVASAVVAVNGIVQLQDQASFNAMFDAKEREQAVVEPEPVAGQSKSGIAKPTPVEID